MLAAVATFADEMGYAYCGQETLAEMTDMTERSVREHLHNLEHAYGKKRREHRRKGLGRGKGEFTSDGIWILAPAHRLRPPRRGDAPLAEDAPDEGALGESRLPDRQDDRISPERPTSDPEANDPRVAKPESDVVADPDGKDRIFAWKLTKTEDPFGNRIVYDYEREQFEDGSQSPDQPYLKTVRYADHENAADETLYLVSVAFVYEDELEAERKERPDSFSDHRAGFEIRTRRRCKRIEIQTHAGEDTLVRTYELVYRDELVARGELPEAALPRNGVSLLSRIRVTGHDESREEDRTEELPPLEFGYTRFEPEERDFLPIEGLDRPPLSLANPDYELADLIGNGLPDVLEMNGTVRYWRNLGNGRFDRPREMPDAPAGLGLADPGVQMIDADADVLRLLPHALRRLLGQALVQGVPAGPELRPRGPGGPSRGPRRRRRHGRHPLREPPGVLLQRSGGGMKRDPAGRA